MRTTADDIVDTLAKMIGGPLCSRDDALRFTHTAVREAVRAAISAEREACARMLDDLAREARTARDNFRELGVLDGLCEMDARRHDAYASAHAKGAYAIRARGAET